MGQALRFAIVLILGLGFITWGASVVVDRTTQGWFEKDISLRARLAVSGARRALIAHWLEDPPENLRELLSEVVVMPLMALQGAGPLRWGFGIRRVITRRASASSSRARCAPRQ